MRIAIGFAASVVLAAAAALGAPAGAEAETRTFINTRHLFPTGGALTEGPANVYPSSIVVTGVPGTVTKATVTMFNYGSSRPNDTDAVLVGPNGRRVMLLSDACGTGAVEDNNLTFDDGAAGFVSSVGPCGDFVEARVRPSNYDDPALDAFPGGPSPPYLNALSFLNGSPANGRWSLFMFDDEAGFFGFEISGWALTLDVRPPPAATGQRAAALKKCKKKKSKKKRKKCRKRAKRLPV